MIKNNKYLKFILDQFTQIKKGDWRIFLSKLAAFPLILMAIPAVFLVRILSIFICVRLGNLISFRMGHFVINTELYLCERDAGMHGVRNFDVFYYSAPAANQQLKKMWNRAIRVWSFGKWVDRVNRLLPGWPRHVISLRSEFDIKGLLRNQAPHISFTVQEEEFGRKELNKLGIKDDDSFVCFHARDSAYLKSIQPLQNWASHDYRDSDINNYILSVQELTKRGYYAIRMGAVVKEPLTVSGSKIIDYATNGRSDFLDLFLSAKCRFFVSDTSGVSSLPWIFRRPIVWVNYIPIKFLNTGLPNTLIVPKKLWLRNERRFLTFREIFDSDIGGFLVSQQYDRLGIEVIENTAEEIAAGVIEMDERLRGGWVSSDEDEKLQRCFWDFFKPKQADQVFLMRVSSKFLRENQKLLK